MSSIQWAEVDREVRRLCEGGEIVAATSGALRAYGPQILALLAALHRSENDADEVFSLWSERVFRGLASFAWDCSLRTWLYAIARNTSLNFARTMKARARRELPADSAEIAEVAEQVRSETRPFLRTTAKDKLAAIREALPAEDRLLLVLRVDKRLEWKELSRVMLGEDGDLSEALLARESQRLRKRFQVLKERLVEEGKREGIVGKRKR
jgi:RNA polymerase sigma-70 factor (ECF subfamily)